MLVLSVGQAFVVGRLFGTSIKIEVYFAASSLYQSLVLLMQTGQVTEIATPLFHRLVNARGELAGTRLFAVLVNWLVGLAACLSAAGFFLAQWLIPWLVPGFEQSAQQLAVTMFKAIIPLTALQVLQSLLSCYLTAKKRFVRQELLRLASVATSLLLIVGGSYWLDEWSMVLGLWTGSMIMIGAMVYLAYQAGYRHSVVFWDRTISFREVFRSLPSISFYVVLTQLFSIALTSGLSNLPQGSLAVFSYSRRIFSRLNSLVSRPISMVFFNHYSAELAKNSHRTMELTREALRICLVATCFMFLTLLAAGYSGLKFLWLSDQFPASHVWETYLVLVVLSLIPFASGPGMVYRKINVSRGDVVSEYNARSLAQITCGVAAYYLIPEFGLWCAVSIVFLNPCLHAAASASILYVSDPKRFSGYSASELANCAILLGAIGLPVAAVIYMIPDTEVPWVNLVVSGLLGGGAIFVAVIASVRLGMPEPIAGWKLIKNRFDSRF